MIPPHVLPQTGDGTAKKDESAAAAEKAASPSRRRLILPCLSVIGLASLTYLLGAAVMFFDLPSSSFLRRGFVGGAAWYGQQQAAQVPGGQLPSPTVGRIDKPDKTYDGFTLVMHSGGTQATLLNMAGDVVHQWNVRFRTVWPDPPPLRVAVDETAVYFNDAYLYPNGDLLALVEGPADPRNQSNGYGLVKLDKDSHVLWKYTANCHHSLDVAEDGTIYVLTNQLVEKTPQWLWNIPAPCIMDSVDVLSPEGQRRKQIPLLEAVKDSPYAPLLCTLEKPMLFSDVSPPDEEAPALREQLRRRDVLHTNAVKVLGRGLAPKFPLFKAGQLLVSPRHLDALVVLDPDSGKVVWAARGPWHAQHDPSFLDDGHLLLFDNLGSARGSRVLEYDPQTQSIPWSYPGDNDSPFLSRIRGACQRLPNGNTLVVNSEAGEAFEVTAAREVVWSCSCGRVELNRARRYAAAQLPFLAGGARARP